MVRGSGVMVTSAWSATNRSGAHAPAAATSARTPATPPHRIAQTATTAATSTATDAATSRPHLTSPKATGPDRVIDTSRASHQGAQVGQQGLQRAGPVGRRVLLGGRQLGGRARLPLGHEDRVVAEAVGAPRGPRETPGPRPVHHRLGAAR